MSGVRIVAAAAHGHQVDEGWRAADANALEAKVITLAETLEHLAASEELLEAIGKEKACGEVRGLAALLRSIAADLASQARQLRAQGQGAMTGRLLYFPDEHQVRLSCGHQDRVRRTELVLYRDGTYAPRWCFQCGRYSHVVLVTSRAEQALK